MRNTIFIVLIFLPLITLGQDKNVATDSSPTGNTSGIPLLWNTSIDSEGNIETTLIDDRNFYRSFINFNLKRSHSLSFTATTNSLFKMMNDQELEEELFDVEPSFDIKWKFKKSKDSEDLFDN